MKVGEQSILAIESGISQAYEDPSKRALGFFVLRVGGLQYGVCSPDATLLACSFDQVGKRIEHRGKHNAIFAKEADAPKIADAFRDAIFAPDQERKVFFGMPHGAFCDSIYTNNIQWAPDGDEAFDDSSYVLQFDIGDQVRLIAFKCENGYHHDPSTLRDVWLDADGFYGLLKQWHDCFRAEWIAAPKQPTNLSRG